MAPTKRKSKKTVAKRSSKKRVPSRRGSGGQKGRRNKKSTGPVRKRRWFTRLFFLGLFFAGCTSLYLLYLDHVVQKKFEGKRWAIPARVYGRPLELYPGAAISSAQLKAELTLLGYQKVSYPKREGSWSSHKGRFLVRTRAFQFWDSEMPARYMELGLVGGVVNRLVDSKGREISLVRLPAPEVGSIHPAHNEDRILIRRDDMPPLLVQALIASEDRDFYQHSGVDPRGILRALWANMRAGGLVQGGSTLTQQLVKNFYLTRERTLWRKLNEAAMALLLESHYSKDEILEAYANEIYLGQQGARAIHGFGLASQFYFGTSLEALDLAQITALVALVRGPSYYDPRRHPERAKKRRNLILKQLADRDVITSGKATKTARTKLILNARQHHGGRQFPAFMDLVRRQLHRDYREDDLTSEGLRIFTTLDPWVQQQTEAALTNRLDLLEREHHLPRGKLESAAVVVDSQGGEVMAMAGGRRQSYAGFNRALDAVRPIGSLIKPVVYLAALMRSDQYTLMTSLADTPLTIDDGHSELWSPRNYDRKTHGDVPLHKALSASYNLATVRLGMSLGLGEIRDLLSELGVGRPINPVPAMLLGAVSLSPLEVAQLYQTMAAGGFYSPLRAIREVLASDGQPLQRYPLTVNQVVESGPVYLLNHNLQEVVQQGTGRGLSRFISPEMGVAGKTGTTDDLRDSWFAGFSGDKVGVVWIGRDDNSPAGLTGSSGALPLWGDMMRRLRPAPLILTPPDEVEMAWVIPETGLLANEYCKGSVEIPFIQGSAPTITADCARGASSMIKRLFWGDD
ncbi:MAG: penicillin-binding protein 1B [Gammaproteobacteria bacterium]|nr:penicillin-binding protein 1B [Gammaproteobacteria bacterium]